MSFSNLGKMLYLYHYLLGKVLENHDIYIGKVYFIYYFLKFLAQSK